MSLNSLKTTIAAALILTSLSVTAAEAADRSNSPGASRTPQHQRLLDVGSRTVPVFPLKIKCAVFSPSGADSRHIAYWRDNGMPVPAGTKVKVKVLTYIGHPTLPAIAQGAKHVILNNMPSWPVPIATACQATVM